MKKQITKYAKKELVEKKWFSINAENQVLGRLASNIAKILIGKHSKDYTPSVDTGDFVVVYNAQKVIVTGKKSEEKIYYRHSGYPGGLKEIPYLRMLEKKPNEIIYTAVKGMLPKNKLGKKMLTKLKIYKGSEHPHEAQSPTELNNKEL